MEDHVSNSNNLNGSSAPVKAQADKGQVKDPWAGCPVVKSRSELLAIRKQKLLPDPSFDIDKDGHIDNLDLFISKRFDKDQDGKLNALERENAEKALKQGFLSNFKLGLESIGPNGYLRTLQKRGVIIDSEGSNKLLETYPMKKNTSLPSISSRTELMNSRKQLQHMPELPEKNFRVSTVYVRPEDYVPDPAFKSAREVKEAYQKQLREAVGMTEPKDLKNFKELSTGYIKSPSFLSQSQMNAEKKRELLASLQEKANYKHKSREAHLLEREKYMIYFNEGKTLKALKDQKRLEVNEFNHKTFSSSTIGMHGHELPKFAENLNEYWKLKAAYVEQPLNHSNVVFSMKKLNRAPIDKFRLADVTGEELPPSPHKLETKRKCEITEKPNHIIPFGGYTPVEYTDSEYAIPKIKYRMSTIVGHFIDSAAEMGISLLPANEASRTERVKNALLDASAVPISEVPRTSNSAKKIGTIKAQTTKNPLRTTGFLKRPAINS